MHVTDEMQKPDHVIGFQVIVSVGGEYCPEGVNLSLGVGAWKVGEVRGCIVGKWLVYKMPVLAHPFPHSSMNESAPRQFRLLFAIDL